MMDHEITKAMITAAETLEREARRYREKAAALKRERTIRQRQQNAFEALPLDASPAIFAKENGLHVETVISWQVRKQRADRRARRLERNREVMRLAALGWTNAQIGHRVGLSPAYISQIISKQLRGRLWPTA